MEQNNNNNNNNNGGGNNNNWNWGDDSAPYGWDGQYRVGAYCADDGKSIYLGVFYDDGCSMRGSTSLYSSMNYGASLPYSNEPIIPLSACIDCNDPQAEAENNNNGNGNNNNNNNNGNNQQWNNMEPREFCIQSYEQAAKCEKNVNGSPFYYPYTSGCNFIDDYLPHISSSSFMFSAGSGSKASLIFAWLFGITTILFGAYAYFLYRKIKRGGAGLASQEGSLA